MKKFVMAIILAAAPVTGAAAMDDPLGGLFGPSMSKEEMAKAIEKASEHPLGSEKNPVRVNMPNGERGYLARLRCDNDKSPAFRRMGSAGIGPFGNILDIYDVQCKGGEPAKTEISMDMYHPKHEEKNAVPGFTVAKS